MSGEIAAAGDMMTGMLASRAVEPSAGPDSGRAHGHAAQGALCLNCGTRLIGEHCHRCGQSGHVHRTIGAIGHELLHGVFHFEGKIWRTLPMLFFRPGELTRRYVAGERARFVSPLALFLFSVFLMFAIVASVPSVASFGDGVADGFTDDGRLDGARAKLAEERLKTQASIKRDLQKLAEERRDADPDQERIRKLEKRIAEMRASERQMAQAQRFLVPPDPKAVPRVKTSNSWLEKKWETAKANPNLLFYKVKTSAYKYSWALIPISLPFIWLLFPFRRGVGLYDHAVFATYSLSFMSLFAVLMSVLAATNAPEDVIGLSLAIIPPLHIYKQLKGAYRLSRAGALWRTMWMLFFSIFTLTFFLLFLFAMGASG
jgi:hypothetical protein